MGVLTPAAPRAGRLARRVKAVPGLDVPATGAEEPGSGRIRRFAGRVRGVAGRPAFPGLVPVTTIALVLMIAMAVTFQAQRVVGQDHLEEVRLEMRDQARRQAELRAAAAEAEAPAQILEAADELGMVEPSAAVAVAAPAPLPVEGVGPAGTGRG